MGRAAMRKPGPLTLPGAPPFAAGTTNRFGRSRLGSGLDTHNSNTRVSAPSARRLSAASAASIAVSGQTSHLFEHHTAEPSNLGLNSDRLRLAMVQRLRQQGIQNEAVLAAMQAVPRHLFVDQGLASRAYEDAALPIGYGQTISQPWVVARMVSAICENGTPGQVLEVGAGCGYQAAVLAQCIKQVHAVERIRGLFDAARQRLQQMGLGRRVRLVHGDGMLGLPAHAPFDAIVTAAAATSIPQALLEQLAPGGRLIAPEGGPAVGQMGGQLGSQTQRLVLVIRTGKSTWQRQELEAVRFVPLLAGTQS